MYIPFLEHVFFCIRYTTSFKQAKEFKRAVKGTLLLCISTLRVYEFMEANQVALEKLIVLPLQS